jgi:hypothetical protein
MLQKLWNVARVSIRVDGKSDRDRRLSWTAEILGRSVDSWSDLGRTKEVDDLKGALLAIAQPSDLGAQLRQARQRHTRARFVLDRLIVRLGVDRNYVQGVIDQMAFLHPSSFIRHPSLDELTFEELEKVLIALRKQIARQKKTGAAPATSANNGNTDDLVPSSSHAVEAPF